ncbi:hypothetical protein LOTGIDRAFT_165963 [Lottia gigantea]|uniref:RING-type domain-containing protein n=1 Tax=Lottia gigantea TaxID=225164 RepID=V4BHJ4_LOTGI|nr:hypothetical protein LOTGIDRAFT_165963 [Lottia gigantea]ESO88204.1 hypothetical protein LOTGIDRAFT_165963 [Lottia gigantea]
MSQSKNTCSICLSECMKPRTLECSHKFCEECVTDYEKQFKDEECFPCPMCRMDINVKGEATETTESESRLTSVKEYCHAHDDVVENYCLDCKQLVCHRCCLTTHKPHKMATLEERYPECMEEFQSAKEDLEKQLPRFNLYSQQVKVKIREIRKSGDEACQDVDDRIQDLTRALVQVGEDLKSEIWQNCLGEETKMNDRLSQSTNGTQTILANLKYADDVKDKPLSEIEHFKSVLLGNKGSNERRNFIVADFNRTKLVKGTYKDDLTSLVGRIRVIKAKPNANYPQDKYEAVKFP